MLHTTYLEADDDRRTNKSGLTILLMCSLEAIIQCTPAAARTTALLLLHSNGDVQCSRIFTTSLLQDVYCDTSNLGATLFVELERDKYSSGPSM